MTGELFDKRLQDEKLAELIANKVIEKLDEREKNNER